MVYSGESDVGGTTLSRFFALFEGLRTGEIAVKDFCVAYERLWTYEATTENVPSSIYPFLSALFDEVVLFSPFPKEQWEYPRYRTGDEIHSAATKAHEAISESGLN